MTSTLSTRNISIVLNDKYEINLDLHIKVSITKSRLALPNSAKLEIFNISEKTFIRLKAEPLIKVSIDGKQSFTGKVINVPNEYKGTSWLCTIYCNDVRTKPFKKPQYLDIPKGTTNEGILKAMASSISDVKLDTSAFSECAKSKGSLLKSMVVEFKKEGDIMGAMQNMFKGCDAEVIKEDGTVKIQHTGSVPNQAKPLKFDRLLESPKLSHRDIEVKIPFNSKVKLGYGFEIQPKSISTKIEAPYTYKNQFELKTYRISEFTHVADNFTTTVAITTIKGLNFG
ncbi:MAG: hypothetical protein COB61_005725 [Thiotrichales bacterium]|nr:hypothetical protein [Thiotrichales bacterium]